MRKISLNIGKKHKQKKTDAGSASGKVIDLDAARRARQNTAQKGDPFWASLHAQQPSSEKKLTETAAEETGKEIGKETGKETGTAVKAADEIRSAEKTAEDVRPAEKAAEATRLAEKTAGKGSDADETAGAKTGTNEPAEEKTDKEKSGSDPLEEDWRDTLAYLETEEKQAEQRAKKTDKKGGGKRSGRGFRWELVLLLLLLIGGGYYLYQRFAPSTARMDSASYFAWMIAREKGTEAEDETLAEDELAVMLNDQVRVETAILSDEKLYLNYDMVLNNIFTRFYWDTSLERMLFTTADDTWQIPLDSDTYTTKDGSQKYEVPMFITRGDSKYICADLLQEYADMTYEMWPEDQHVHVITQWGESLGVSAARNIAVRFGSSSKQEIVTTLNRGDSVTVLDQGEKWTRVLTPDGYIGWVQSSALTEPETVTTDHEYTPADYSVSSRDEKINLVWHQISSTDGNQFFASDTAGMTGVNVISPTWFSLTDNDGNFSSYAEKSYVRKAHNKDLEVWGLVDNFSANMSTATLTANAASRAALITNLINAALEVGLDGINIDFETISQEAGHSYVQFMRELSVACRANDLVLSVDVPVPTVYSTQYDRSELGVFCDYIIMMGYDEHYSGSEAGSVASLSFEENGIRDSLTEIPAGKLISAVPFYTRLWYTLDSSTWSEAYGMNTIATTIDTYNVETVWNEETQQNYAEWTLDDGTLCRIWVEDEESLALKADLVRNYELGGIAAWVLGFERSSVWSVLSEHIGS